MGKRTKLRSGSGKHVSSDKPAAAKTKEQAKKPAPENFWERQTPAKRTLIVLACVMALALSLFTVAWFSVTSSIKPPVVGDDPVMSNKDPNEVTAPNASREPGSTGDTNDGSSSTTVSGRKDGFYTVLLMGQNYGLTDVMMLAGFDTVNHTIDVVSIPRDTYCTVIQKDVKKINGAYNYGGKTHEEKIASVYDAVQSVTGFRPDNYMLIDYKGFVKLVDTLGGVEFNVPMPMYHVDDSGDVDINLQKGYQLLNGRQALGLVRYRKGYADQDLGRIRTAQGFLSATVQKAVKTISFDKIGSYVGIAVDYLETDLTAGEMIWFMQQAYSVDLESDLNFHAPAADKELDAPTFNGASYVALRADKWLQMINTTVNPYTRYITFDDVSIYHPYYTPKESYLPEGMTDDNASTTPTAKPSNNTTTKPASTATKPASTTTKPATTTSKPSSGNSTTTTTTTPKPSNSGGSTSKPSNGSSGGATTTPKPVGEPSGDDTGKPSGGDEEEPTGQPGGDDTPDVTDTPVDEPTEEPTVEPSEEPFVPATHE